MTPGDFDVILESRIDKVRMVLGFKAQEYARGNDRLHNFKRVARVKGCSVPEACLDGYYKHFVSLLDMVDDYKNGKDHPVQLWDEKFGDAINYLILLEAIIKENINEKL